MNKYIVFLSKDEYLVDYDIDEGRIEVTGMENKAKQFDSKYSAEYVAEWFGGRVKEVKAID